MREIDEIISQIVKNKTFLDIGPCWLTVNEKISVAFHAGCQRATGIDMFEEQTEHVANLRERLKQLEVSYEFHSGTKLEDYQVSHDVVYCSGVAYHQASPHLFFQKMNQLTNEHLILKSTVTPNKIGDFNMPAGSAIFMPAISETDREAIALDWQEFLKGNPASGLNIPKYDWNAKDSHGWWWLFTPEFLLSQVQIAGFELAKHQLTPDNRQLIIHARKV